MQIYFKGITIMSRRIFRAYTPQIDAKVKFEHMSKQISPTNMLQLQIGFKNRLINEIIFYIF